MAKRRRVMADAASAEVTELRRSFNTLLLVLENISEQVDAATITATEGFVALGLAISTGTDSDVTGINGGANNYTGTGLEVSGVKVTNPVAPKRLPDRGTEEFAVTDTDL